MAALAMRDPQAEGDVEPLTMAHGTTPRGNVLGIAPIDHAERIHLQWIEIHECDCGQLVAHCVIHDSEIYCRACGMSY